MSEWCFSNSYIFFFTNRAVLVISKLVGFTSDDVCLFISMIYIGGVYKSFFFFRKQIHGEIRFEDFLFQWLNCGEDIAFFFFSVCHAIAAQHASQNPEWIRLLPSFYFLFLNGPHPSSPKLAQFIDCGEE